MAYQSQTSFVVPRLTVFTPRLQARDHQQEVAKLIDVTTCIGCKACQGRLFQENGMTSSVIESAATSGCTITPRI